MSKLRKSATVVMPVWAAITLGFPSWSVKGSGRVGLWNTVWPWWPIAAMSLNLKEDFFTNY